MNEPNFSDICNRLDGDNIDVTAWLTKHVDKPVLYTPPSGFAHIGSDNRRMGCIAVQLVGWFLDERDSIMVVIRRNDIFQGYTQLVHYSCIEPVPNEEPPWVNS